MNLDDKPITYELLDEPRKMHVIAEEGIRKFSFANARSWQDLLVTGPLYPKDANVEIVAIAHVSLTAEDGIPTAIYCMDALALGPDFETTGRPAYTIGFNHTQLADGHVEPPIKTLSPEREQHIKVVLQSDKDQPSPGLAALPTTELDYTSNNDNFRKIASTYVPFEDGPKVLIFKEKEFVRDHSERRKDKEIPANSDYLFSGTFIGADGEEYARPTAAAKNYLWYGAKRSNLLSEQELLKELYNEDVAKKTAQQYRIATKKLRAAEKYYLEPLARFYFSRPMVNLRQWLDKNKKEK